MEKYIMVIISSISDMKHEKIHTHVMVFILVFLDTCMRHEKIQ